MHTVDQIGVQERVKRLKARSIKQKSKLHALTLTLSMIDLTTLEGRDSPSRFVSSVTRLLICTKSSLVFHP